MSSILSTMYCEHANECPNVCPCPPNCSCRSTMCPPSEEGRTILSRRISDNVMAEARILGDDRATVALHYGKNGVREGRSAGVLEPDGSFSFGDSDARKIAEACADWGSFLDELRSAMPVATVLLS